MKAIMEFDLDDFDDRKAHLRCTRSLDLACVIFEFTRNSRKKLRNEEKFTVDDVFDHFHELLEEQNINIDELID